MPTIGSFVKSILGGSDNNTNDKRMNMKVVQIFITKCKEIQSKKNETISNIDHRTS